MTGPLRLEPLGRLWQQAWLDDAGRGGPLLFADWLAALPDGLDSAPDASWRIDLLVADRSVAEPAQGGRCLDADGVAVVEGALAELAAREAPMAESVRLLAPAVAVLADSPSWPVPTGLRDRLGTLARLLGERLAAEGVDEELVERLVGLPAGDAGSAPLDLDRVATACLAVPRAVADAAQTVREAGP